LILHEKSAFFVLFWKCYLFSLVGWDVDQSQTVMIYDLGSISSKFYKQLLLVQIPKAQKILTTWLNFLLSARINVAHRMLMKMTPGVNFINILCTPFVPIFLCQKITQPKCNKRKAAQSTFLHKVSSKDVDENDTCSQFHQHYTHTFFVQIILQSQNVTRKTMFVQKICMYNVDEIDTWSLSVL